MLIIQSAIKFCTGLFAVVSFLYIILTGGEYSIHIPWSFIQWIYFIELFTLFFTNL